MVALVFLGLSAARANLHKQESINTQKQPSYELILQAHFKHEWNNIRNKTSNTE
jgi:hypothetical protein